MFLVSVKRKDRVISILTEVMILYDKYEIVSVSKILCRNACCFLSYCC